MTEPMEDRIPDSGSSTDQFVSGYPETGESTVDAEPTADTPAHGSSNEGVNVTGANRVDQNRVDQNRVDQNRVDQNRVDQNRAESD